MKHFLMIFLLLSSLNVFASPDWAENARILTPRKNPYLYEESLFIEKRSEGLQYTLDYPVEISGMLIPFRALEDFLNKPTLDPFKILLKTIFKNVSQIKNTEDLFKTLGLQTFPNEVQSYPFDLPASKSKKSNYMGVTLIEKNDVELMTLSCAACHVGNLFGKKIIGMTNRFPRANEAFVLGKKAASVTTPFLFQTFLTATKNETNAYRQFRNKVNAIGVKMPVTLGLDTSLSQVALSLAHRNLDEDATYNETFEKNPRPDLLDQLTADSKPAVWWNLKYKNRWLSDGSVVSGNPIYTNFLWNEIGRGTDLTELSDWLNQNQSKIDALTTAVFSTEAPLYTDFFSENRIDLAAAKRGQQIFKNKCEECHGSYEKNWDSLNANQLPLLEQLKTTRVLYPEQTEVFNVGTDSGRREGMKSLERALNPLRISKENNIVIRSQNGYVPPPLVGIWSRWPYFHNNSAPSLCAVLSPEEERPKTYYAGEALSKETDFDEDCNGYPIGEKTPETWKTETTLFDSSKPGLSNVGHNVGVKSASERHDLIQFLKTL